MANKSAWSIAGPVGRLAFEMLLWLPAWLLLMNAHSGTAKTLTFAAAAASFVVGVAVSQFRPPWRLLAMLLLMLLLVASTVAVDWRESAIGVWLAAAAWRGRYGQTTPIHYVIAFGIAAAATLVAANVQDISNDRILFAALAVIWLAGTMIASNRHLVQEAGLHSPIVTRAVRRDSRKYTFVFLAVVLALFGATLYYALQWFRLPRVNLNIGGESTYEPLTQPSQPNLLPFDKPHKPSPIWDWIGYIVGGIIALALLAGLYRLWRNRTWSWRSFKDALIRMFLRDRKEETLPYVEERRSLPKEKSRFGGLFHRQPRGPDWKQLDNSRKVRRLYADALAAGVGAGYSHQASHTPSEAMSGLAEWREARQSDPKTGTEKRAAYWIWFSGVREALLRLYEQARYGERDLKEQDVAELLERHPDREKL